MTSSIIWSQISYQPFLPQFILRNPYCNLASPCSPNMPCSLQPTVGHLPFSLFPASFPNFFRKANLLPSLAGCWTEVWILFLFSNFLQPPLFLCPYHSLLCIPKASSCSKAWTSLLLLLLDESCTVLILNFPLFVLCAGLYLSLVHAAFEKKLFFGYFFCPISPWASFRHITSGQIFHIKYLGYIFNSIPLLPGPIIEWIYRKNRHSVAEWEKCFPPYSKAAHLTN